LRTLSESIRPRRWRRRGVGSIDPAPLLPSLLPPSLYLYIFDDGDRASIFFENVGDAESFMDQMTFSFHGPLFIPSLPYGSDLGPYIRQSRHRAVSFGY
jgi:hypothetical protein